MDPSHFLLVLFALDALVNVIANVDEKRYRRVIYITKPLLMPLLILYFATASAAPGPLIIVALAFGCLGDVFLMLPGEREILFLGGLGAFLVNQMLFVAAFVDSLGALQDAPLWLWSLGAPYLVFGVFYYRLLAPRLGKLRGPVIVYMTVILAMGLSALLRHPFVEGSSFWPVLCGSVLFIVSDSVLAFDRFVRPLRLGRMAVMATYIAAQYLIAWGFIS